MWKKGQLSVVYMPVIFFSYTLIERNFSASITYLIYLFIIGFYVFNNPLFIKRNVFAIILLFYFILLLPGSKDLAEIRPIFFAAILLFFFVPILSDIFRRYPREVIFNELSKASMLVLTLFIINVILASLFRYMPLGTGYYGSTSGLMYGMLSLDDLNVLPFVCLVVIRKGIKDKKLLYILVYLIAAFFILLTFRRTVMVLTVLAAIIVFIELLNFDQILDFFKYGVVISLISLVVIYQTGFLNSFWERYENRNLDERGLENEPRLLEFEMIYKDMFVYYDYSPWFGYELFNSHGNYGKGQLGTRSLHTDFGTIMHASGILGFVLYCSMVFVAFYSAWKRTHSRADYLQFFFLLLAFFTFFMSGRWHVISAMSMMYSILYLPLCIKSNPINLIGENSIEETQNQEKELNLIAEEN